MGVFRFTKDIDFLVLEEWVEIVDRIMVEFGYEKQGFSTEEIVFVHFASKGVWASGFPCSPEKIQQGHVEPSP